MNEYSTKKVGYYESFLYDILSTGYEAANVSKMLSKSVTSIEASTLKKITIKSKVLKKNAFKGINKKAKIKVPKNKLKKYTKLLKKAKTPGGVCITK